MQFTFHSLSCCSCRSSLFHGLRFPRFFFEFFPNKVVDHEGVSHHCAFIKPLSGIISLLPGQKMATRRRRHHEKKFSIAVLMVSYRFLCPVLGHDIGF